MKAIHQNSRNTTIKIIAIIALLFFTTQQAKAVCNLHAGFTYTVDTLFHWVHFNSTSTSDTAITSWKYDFGNGAVSTLENPFYSFNQNGSSTVCLTVTDSNNCTDTFCDVVNYNGICNTSFLDVYKRYGVYKITRYTKLNDDLYYEVVGKFPNSNQTSYQLFKCSGSQVCGTGNINTFDSCRNLYISSFIDSTVIWNLADTVNADCESSWLNHYTDYAATTALHITNGLIYDQMIQTLKDSILIARNAWQRRGFLFYVYDSNTGQNWQTYHIGNTCRGTYNDVMCNRFPDDIIEFTTKNSVTDSISGKQQRQYVIDFLNSIPCNAYVLGYSFFNAGYNEWLADSTSASDQTLFSAFERLGVTNIRQQQENYPFVFFTQNCNANFETSQLQTSQQNVIDTTFIYPNTFTGTNGCKNQSIKKYFSNQYGIVYEITPIDHLNATRYKDCNGNDLLWCNYRGFTSDDTFCNRFIDSLIYLNTFWQCQSLCDTVTCLLPGDADHDLTVNNYDALAIGLSYNRTGNIRPNATTQYTLQPCDNWNTTHYYGFNDKFSDCNGDGIINSIDASVIDQNYIALAQNHFNHRESNVDSLPAVTLVFDTLPTTVVTTTCDGAQIEADINVGSAAQPITNAYGVAFSVNYPFDNDSCFKVEVDLDPNSWLQTNNPVLLFYKNIPQFNRVDIAVVRTDGATRSGNGRIGKIKMITEGAVFKHGRLSSLPIFDFSVTDVVAINNVGQKIEVNGSSTTVSFITLGTKQNKVEGLKFYPNPTTGKIYINAKETIETIKIVDTQGRTINEISPNKNDVQLDISNTEKGMYILEIKGKNSVSYEKIFKQ